MPLVVPKRAVFGFGVLSTIWYATLSGSWGRILTPTQLTLPDGTTRFPSAWNGQLPNLGIATWPGLGQARRAIWVGLRAPRRLRLGTGTTRRLSSRPGPRPFPRIPYTVTLSLAGGSQTARFVCDWTLPAGWLDPNGRGSTGLGHPLHSDGSR